jgi:butyryl-CoA dehydrogenase
MILTQEQEMIRDSLRDFAQERLAPFAAEWDRHHTFPADALRELGELGALGMVVPEQWGGAGMDYMSLVLVIEEIAAGDGATSTIVSVQNSLACGITMKYGSDEQKETWLKPLARGEMLGCFCLTEPHTGSDAAAITTRADRDGDFFVSTASSSSSPPASMRRWRSSSPSPTRPPARREFPASWCRPTTPGYIVARIEEKMGQHASDTAQILFENCRIPGVLPARHGRRRLPHRLSNLEAGRIGIAAQSVGMARAAFEAAVQYAKERETFGKPIIEHQAVSFRLADMATQIDAARLLVWRAATYKDAGKPCLKEASMAKMFASEMAEKVCSDAIQILGGYGYVSDFPVERIYRDVRVCQIYEGANDIQRLVIGRAVAGD